MALRHREDAVGLFQQAVGHRLTLVGPQVDAGASRPPRSTRERPADRLPPTFRPKEPCSRGPPIRPRQQFRRSASILRKKPSASGLRHVLPVQMNRNTSQDSRPIIVSVTTPG